MNISKLIRTRSTIKFAGKLAGKFPGILSAAMMLALVGCGQTQTSTYDTSSAEVMGETIGGAANATDSGGSIVSFNKSVTSPSPWTQSLKLASQIFESPAQASNMCIGNVFAEIIGGGGSGCSSNTMTITLNNCTGLMGTWQGTDSLNYSSAGACTTADSSGLVNLTSGESVTMTSSSGLTLTTFDGKTVETDSNSSGFSIPESGGITMACTGATCGSARTVTINGLHRKLTNSLGAIQFDHTLSTPTGFTVSGTGSSKTITAGTFQLEHNLAHFIATSQVTSPLTFSANCCLPTGGTMVTTFSSGKTGSETVTFGPTCGVATVNGTEVAMNYCQ